ncbi:MAG: dioxygenase family protein [Planctomycetota bacterium]
MTKDCSGKLRFTRRAVARHLGTLAGGAALLGPGIARALMKTPSQTAGPFYPPQPHGETDVDLTLLEGHTEHAAGDVILVRGRVTDLAGNPLGGARVDIWQANHYGRYAHPRDRNTAPLDPNFQGIGIAHTDSGGWYGFRTIRPAPYPLAFVGDSGMRARHIHFKVAHEGTGRLTTQMYFAGDPLIAKDSVMRGTPEGLRHLLITTAVEDEATGLPVHRFDIALG